MAIFSFKYYFIILTSIIILLSNTQYAYATPSNEMYDYIIDSYFFGVKLGLNNLATSKNEDAKTKFVNKIKQNFNKQDFKNKTYDCFSKYNDKDILTNNKIVGTCSNNYFQNYILSQQAAFKELYMAQ